MIRYADSCHAADDAMPCRQSRSYAIIFRHADYCHDTLMFIFAISATTLLADAMIRFAACR